MHSQPVTFIELQGPNARARLDAVRARLTGAGLPARLLRGRDQADLYLLIIEGDPELGDREREGARIWRFADSSAHRGPASGSPRGTRTAGDPGTAQ